MARIIPEPSRGPCHWMRPPIMRSYFTRLPMISTAICTYIKPENATVLCDRQVIQSIKKKIHSCHDEVLERYFAGSHICRSAQRQGDDHSQCRLNTSRNDFALTIS